MFRISIGQFAVLDSSGFLELIERPNSRLAFIKDPESHSTRVIEEAIG